MLTSFYIFLSIMVSISSILILALSSKVVWVLFATGPSSMHRFQRFVFFLFIFSPLGFYATPVERLTIVSAQPASDNISTTIGRHRSHVKAVEAVSISPSTPVRIWISILLGLSIFFFIAKYCLDQIKIKIILKSSYRFKSFGKVVLLISDKIRIPFAYRGAKYRYVVIPSQIVENSVQFSLAIRHEMQHHRQGDPLWSHLAFVFKSLFFWNPLVYLMLERVSEIQEFACDEALIGRKDVGTRQYCDCLVSVAEQAISSQRFLVGTTGMALGNSAKKLKRRIEMMSQYNRIKGKRFAAISEAISIMAIASVALASSGMIRDKHISLVEAKNLVTNAVDNNFPVEVNEQILDQLNYYVGTPRGRKFIKQSLARRHQFEAVFQRKLLEHAIPNELLAVAMMESGFENSPQNAHPQYSAGVWQIIPQTARHFGLKVDEVVDERLEIELATDAALRLLRNDHERFKDWRLAIVAYNAGQGKVQRGIDKTGSRDPWVLIEAGYDGDSDYLAKVMAGVLILKNPSLVE